MADSFSNPSFGVASSDNKALSDAASNLGKNPTNTTKGQKDNPSVANLRYPLKMIDSSTDYLQLQIYEYSPPGLGNITDILKSLIETKENTSNNATLALEQLVSAGAPGKEKNEQKLKGQIILPIPGNLTDSNSVGWGEDPLDPLSMFGASVASGAMKDPLQLLTELQNVAKNVTGIKASVQSAATAGLAAAAVNSFGGNVSATGLISRATGQVFNPNLELLFQGPSLRAFPFTFDFAPRNQKEAQIVKEIIRTLKKSMFSKKNASGGVFLGAPDVFKIQYRKGGSKHPFLNTFKDLALTDIQLNYTGSGTYATYHDGTPVHIQMSLTFKELNPIYSEDYDDIPLAEGVGY